ncbi:SDR family oxidoreductase [Coriobacteriia bacterium Es71-Z0120]|uniref:SDR family oxidoreductase n=1 Tax=Parvivirga hydrogeniphila TaxID=2939460 RepID=UPI0022609D9A|nr:SDR family oxidoreductase [Parvivirga hydrogeniphila]MCL4078421.1 SDR family oxidoreductase [Parvivirga hydrogeniphila]
MADLTGKVALVTGAASGIGRESALAFARAGAKVVVSDVMVEGGEETVAMIRDGGGDAIFVECDVSKEDDVKRLVARTIEAYGRLDCAHNNAGIEGTPAPIVECTEENWDRTLGINLKGIWWCAKYEIPEMLKVGGGAIVNTASIAGLVAFPALPAYTASKHGVVGLTKSIALDYATQNIRCNAVCPGVIHTPMVDRLTNEDPEALKGLQALEPIGRLGKPSEIADAVVYLCSDEASFITGAALPVDGAYVAQ